MPEVVGKEIGPLGYGLLGKSLTRLKKRARLLIFSQA